MADHFQGSGQVQKSDVFSVFSIVQNTQISYIKDVIISTLRDIFSQDVYYRYVADQFGFPLNPNHTDLDPAAGIIDSSTTRVFIGQSSKFDTIFYPAILVKSGGMSSVPISINRDKETILYDDTIVIDGYGNQKIFTTPIAMITTGAWEGSITIEIQDLGIKSRDDLLEICSMIFVDLRHDDLRRAGVLIKRVSVGGPSEKEDRNNKLFTQTITLDVRGEWRREIPVENIIDTINFCVEFGHTNTKTGEFIEDPNLEWHSTISLLDAIEG